MVTSRDIASTERNFREDVRMDIQAHDEDLRSFIKAYIVQDDQLLDLLQGDNDLLNDTVNSVLQKANGM